MEEAIQRFFYKSEFWLILEKFLGQYGKVLYFYEKLSSIYNN